MVCPRHSLEPQALAALMDPSGVLLHPLGKICSFCPDHYAETNAYRHKWVAVCNIALVEELDMPKKGPLPTVTK